MKTLRTLTGRQLDRLQARLVGKVWTHLGSERVAKIMVRVSNERFRRAVEMLP